jgi:hypothetical protein
LTGTITQIFFFNRDLEPKRLRNTALMYYNGRIGLPYVIGNCIRHRGFNESGADAINTNVELGKFFGGSPGVNFINLLLEVFIHAGPKSATIRVKASVFFVLLGYAPVKAARRTLMKLRPGEADHTGFG